MLNQKQIPLLLIKDKIQSLHEAETIEKYFEGSEPISYF